MDDDGRARPPLMAGPRWINSPLMRYPASYLRIKASSNTVMGIGVRACRQGTCAGRRSAMPGAHLLLQRLYLGQGDVPLHPGAGEGLLRALGLGHLRCHAARGYVAIQTPRPVRTHSALTTTPPSRTL